MGDQMSNGIRDFGIELGNKDAIAMRGTHQFERVGLGKAPFRVTGYAKHAYQAIPGDPSCPVQAGTSCHYCGTGCMYVANIESADGKKFHVGMDCVAKTGDGGLLAEIKSSPEYRAMQRAKRHAKDVEVTTELTRLMADESVRAKLGTDLAHIERSIAWSGASGRAANLRRIRRVLQS
jgi:hypothetical protein